MERDRRKRERRALRIAKQADLRGYDHVKLASLNDDEWLQLCWDAGVGWDVLACVDAVQLLAAQSAVHLDLPVHR